MCVCVLPQSHLQNGKMLCHRHWSVGAAVAASTVASTFAGDVILIIFYLAENGMASAIFLCLSHFYGMSHVQPVHRIYL